MKRIKYLFPTVVLILLFFTATGVATAKPPVREEYATVEQVQQWLSDLSTELTTYIDTQVANLSGAISSLGSQVNDNQNAIADLEARVSYLEGLLGVGGTAPPSI